ncbi:MAG: hypothetical protein JF595_15005 [Sphingomonadales bacterium]|nr:hypothetical protein [Sphingomonadales bacterium]
MASSPFGLRFRFLAVILAALAFAVGTMLPAQSADPTERETFAAPAVNDVPFGSCLTGEGGCGLLAANEFCRTQGYDHAAGWSAAPSARAWLAGSRLICETRTGTGTGARCASLRNVTCARAPAPAGSRTYAVPMANDAPVDRCRVTDGDCGKASADQFCRTQDFEQATSWTWTTYPETWNVGSREFCKASANRRCEGLRNVVCSGGVASRFKVPGGTYALPRLNSQLITPAPNRVEDVQRLGAPPLGLTTTAWVGGSLGQMRQILPAERYGQLFADVATAIAPYSRIARLNDGVELPAAFKVSATTAPDWNAYNRFALADGPASVEAVARHLAQLDRMLLTGDRVALLQELVAIFHKYQR